MEDGGFADSDPDDMLMVLKRIQKMIRSELWSICGA